MRWTASSRPTRRALCSLATGDHAQLLRLSGPTLAAYADRHHYELILVGDTLCASRAPSWSKVELLRTLLASHELVLWVDCDATFVDLGRDVGDELEPTRSIGIVEHRYRDMRVPNMGVVLVRSSERAAAFLDAVWSQTDLIDHHWWENAAALTILGYDLWPCRPARPSAFADDVQFLTNDWNSVEEDPSPTPMIRHYAGKDMGARRAGLAADLRAMRAPLRRQALALGLRGRSSGYRPATIERRIRPTADAF